MKQRIGIVAHIGDHMAYPRQTRKEADGLRAVAPVTGCDLEPDRQAQGIDGGVDLRGQATARASPFCAAGIRVRQ